MIKGNYCVIRSAEQDDAPALWSQYDASKPRTFLLGPAREVVIPSQDELQEILGRRDTLAGIFFIIEDLEGRITGCAALRGVMREAFHCEAVVAFADEMVYGSPMADEVMAFLKHLAFRERRLSKVSGHCLDCEAQYRQFLTRHGFESDGIQRDMVYTQGRYFDLESLSLYRDRCQEVEA